MIDDLERLRAICLRLPETTEHGVGSVGDPAFKVRDKIFAMRHLMHDRMSLWCKAVPGLQEALVTADPARFFVPPYVGQHGWVGIYLDGDVAWEEVGDLIQDSYRLTAPKRLLRLLDAADGGGAAPDTA